MLLGLSSSDCLLIGRQVNDPSYVTDLIRHNQYIAIIIIIVTVTNVAVLTAANKHDICHIAVRSLYVP